MRDFILTAWLSGLRGRSIHAVFAFGLLLLGVAYLAGSFSLRQPDTVVLDVGLSGLRFSLVLLVLFWVQDLVTEEIDRRSVFFVLTYPIPRGVYVVGRYLGILTLLSTALLIDGLLLWILVMTESTGYQQQFAVDLGLPYWATLFGLWLDVAVVAAVALCLAVLSTVRLLPLAVGLMFAVAAKSIGPVMDYLASSAEGDTPLAHRYQPILEVAQWIVPDLSRLDWRVWPMYGVVPDAAALGWSMAMAAAYVVVLVALAVRALATREFR